MNGTQKNNVGTWNDWNKDRIYALEIILINIFSFIQNRDCFWKIFAGKNLRGVRGKNYKKVGLSVPGS